MFGAFELCCREGLRNLLMSAGMLGQLSLALQQLIEDGAWSTDDELKVCIAGTLKKDKFIVIQNTTKRGQTK
jgi:hypothetical protein